MKVLVTGDRNWNRMDIIERELRKLSKDTIIIHGTARGADTIAKFVAERLGMVVRPFKPEWHIYGRAAGPIRNQKMLDEGKPDLVLAFHENLDESVGTKDMVTRARKAGLKVILIER